MLIRLIYFSLLIILLFNRNEEYRKPNFDIYLDEWILKIFVNRVIFINVIGNIILFIPLGIYKGLIKGFLIVLILELLQFYLKRGIFDIVDIILNTIGVFIGCIGGLLYERYG